MVTGSNLQWEMYSSVRWDSVWDSKPEDQALCESHIVVLVEPTKLRPRSELTSENSDSCFFLSLLLPAFTGKKISFLSILLIMAKVNIPTFQIHFLTIQVIFRVAAAAAKTLQSCPALCDPIDSSPPGSPIPKTSLFSMPYSPEYIFPMNKNQL